MRSYFSPDHCASHNFATFKDWAKSAKASYVLMHGSQFYSNGQLGAYIIELTIFPHLPSHSIRQCCFQLLVVSEWVAIPNHFSNLGLCFQCSQQGSMGVGYHSHWVVEPFRNPPFPQYHKYNTSNRWRGHRYCSS